MGLIFISVIEFIFKKDCVIFNYLIDAFIVFVFGFVVIYFFTRKDKFLKGFVYYQLCSLFWGSDDLLYIFFVESSHDWNKSDTLKIVKVSLVGISLIINISYIFSLNLIKSKYNIEYILIRQIKY